MSYFLALANSYNKNISYPIISLFCSKHEGFDSGNIPTLIFG